MLHRWIHQLCDYTIPVFRMWCHTRKKLKLFSKDNSRLTLRTVSHFCYKGFSETWSLVQTLSSQHFSKTWLQQQTGGYPAYLLTRLHQNYLLRVVYQEQKCPATRKFIAVAIRAGYLKLPKQLIVGRMFMKFLPKIYSVIKLASDSTPLYLLSFNDISKRCELTTNVT